MLLQHARLPARSDDAGRLVTLDEQDRSLWDTAEIAEGVAILQGALAEERPGRYQIQAAIAALHADAMTSAETDWPQILAWYDDLVTLSDAPEHDDPAAVLNRAVAVGHVDGARAGLAETNRVRAALGDRDQWHAVRAYLHELGGELEAAADEYAAAAERASSPKETTWSAVPPGPVHDSSRVGRGTLTTRRQTLELDQAPVSRTEKQKSRQRRAVGPSRTSHDAGSVTLDAPPTAGWKGHSAEV